MHLESGDMESSSRCAVRVVVGARSALSTHVRCALIGHSFAVGFGASHVDSERCRLGYASRLPKCAERVPSTLPAVRPCWRFGFQRGVRLLRRFRLVPSA